ncbi:MAG: hypothetical protein A3B22_02095 [Candidatus Zambryskibacteria bacterium RIFCSPLOWO2_01_FULL_47_33]|nr:MAG: hypothetical protein A3B22_02095 [Candidatus Zambryskibacteria bacterium RIFCSPLOWO2_01_FULL_47_33]
MKKVLVCLAVSACGLLVAFSLMWNFSLPTVWYDLRGEKLCAFDSEGNQISLGAVVGRYHLGGYAEKCPSYAVSKK